MRLSSLPTGKDSFKTRESRILSSNLLLKNGSKLLGFGNPGEQSRGKAKEKNKKQTAKAFNTRRPNIRQSHKAKRDLHILEHIACQEKQKGSE